LPFDEQLALARDADLPVLLHGRRAMDLLLKQLRRIPVPGGIVHAFNGSRQQAEAFIELGFKLGFGGALTYPKARRIRELARTLPLDAIVLETDAPDIPPEWISGRRNTPDQLPRIAEVLADLRGISRQALIAATTANALRVLPRLAIPR
jgi:TatD DNase family protein